MRWRRNEGNSGAILLFCKFDFHKLGLGKKVFANKTTFLFAIVDFWVTLAIELQCSRLKLLRGFVCFPGCF